MVHRFRSISAAVCGGVAAFGRRSATGYRRLLLAAAAATAWSSAHAQSPAQDAAWRWLTQGSEARSAVLQHLVTDEAGNVYIAGRFTNQIRLGGTRLVSHGSSDVFVAKLTAGGQWVWAVGAGGPASDGAADLILDKQGHVLLAGFFQGTADFGPVQRTSQGGQDVFVAALTVQGQWQGVMTAGGPGQDEAQALVLDPSQQVVVGGRFQGQARFGSHVLHSSAAGSDGFVARLGPESTWVWAAQTTGTDEVVIKRLAVNAQGHVVATGYFGGTSSFGAHAISSAGTHNLFVASLDAAGQWDWVTAAYSESTVYGNGLDLDSQGNIYLTGAFSGTAQFGSQQLPSHGGDDMYVARLSARGEWRWATTLHGTALESGKAVVVGADGMVYVAGCYGSAARYPKATLPNQGSTDLFVGRLTDAGQWLHVQPAGSAGPDEATAVALAPNGELYVGGTMSSPTPAAVAPQVYVGRLRLPAPLLVAGTR